MQWRNAALKKTRSESSGDLSFMPIHMADLGTDNFEQEFTLSLMESEETTLAQIEAALERIEEGVYGDCVDCGARIPKTRLNAIPYARLCVKCASKLETTYVDPGPTRIPTRRYWAFLAIAIVGTALDLLTKHWVFQWRGMPCSGNEWWLWPGYVGIETGLNPGALFGLGRDHGACLPFCP